MGSCLGDEGVSDDGDPDAFTAGDGGSCMGGGGSFAFTFPFAIMLDLC